MSTRASSRPSSRSDTLSLDVIAQGIETPHQAQRLHSLGCPHGQGFYYSPPLAPKALEAYLTTQAILTPTSPHP